MPKTLWRISDDAFNLDPSNREKWSDLLRQAVSQPGLMLKAYSAIHGYGLGNQLGLRGGGNREEKNVELWISASTPGRSLSGVANADSRNTIS